MPILPVNRNERAWFGFSTRSRRQATAITVAHKHETFSRNLAPDAVGGSGSSKHGADVRRKGSRTIRRVGAGVRRQTISKQNQSCAEQRCGRGTAAQTHSGVLRMLRLAFVGTRALAACETAAHVSKCIRLPQQAREALRKSLTAENLKQEAAYLRGEGRASFERPYGLAWLLQLCAELREWDDDQAREMSANLRPLEDAAIERLKTWLPKLSHPVRIGEHDQTAFGLGLMLDYARSTKNDSFARLVEDSARKFFLADKDCPLNYEPSGEDFLSPCLGEADVMRRVLSQTEFAKWLNDFMPQIPKTGNGDWLKPVVSPDPSDPKLAHLDGLNLSRAWMLEGILSALPPDDRRRAALQAAADAHRRAGLAAVTGAHYEGGHWLGSFAVYLTTQRGIQKEGTTGSQQAKSVSEKAAP